MAHKDPNSGNTIHTHSAPSQAGPHLLDTRVAPRSLGPTALHSLQGDEEKIETLACSVLPSILQKSSASLNVAQNSDRGQERGKKEAYM